MDAFEKLEVWKRSARLCSDIYKSICESREWGLKDQIVRSALSVPSNIAEGYERNSRKEYARFLKIAKGSCGELRTQLYIIKDIQLVERTQVDKYIQEASEISRMLQSLINKISN